MSNSTLVLVTGASRGYGVSIVEELLKSLVTKNDVNENIRFILYARSEDGLKNTKSIIEKLVEGVQHLKVVVDIVPLDFYNLQEVETKFKQSIDSISVKQYNRILFFNNHGSLSRLDHITGYTGHFTQIQQDINLNVTSVIITASQLLTLIKDQQEKGDESVNNQIAFVNISSLAAIKAFDCWGIYCSGKAARDMFYRVISEENKNRCNIKSLNYAPGPMDTDMQKEIREKTVVEESKKAFVDMKENNRLVKPNDSAAKLIRVLLEDKYESGSHIDYFDK